MMWVCVWRIGCEYALNWRRLQNRREKGRENKVLEDLSTILLLTVSRVEGGGREGMCKYKAGAKGKKKSSPMTLE